MKRIITTLFAATALVACDVDLEDKGEISPPKVEMKGGELDVELPEAKVVEKGTLRAPDIDVETPDVHVGTKEVDVKVPDIDVDIPKEDEQ